MLNDLLEELSIDYVVAEDIEIEKSAQLEESLAVVADYYPDFPDELQTAVRNVIKLGLPEPEQESEEEQESETETEQGEQNGL